MSLSISERVQQLIGMANGASFSRGSAGLYATLSALKNKWGAGEVIIPTLCCESVALATVYAGHTPRFADISKDSLCMSQETLMPLMSDKTRAVIVVHLFGIDANAQQFDELKKRYNQTLFIEDIAHAIGARNTDGLALGGALDGTLLSFANDKILPGDGGMMLLSKNAPVGIDEILKLIPDNAATLPQPYRSLSLRNLVHAMADLWRVDKQVAPHKVFLPALNHYRDMIVCRGDIALPEALAHAIDTMETARETRVRHHLKYRELIHKAKVIPISQSGTSWRCPVICDDVSQMLKTTAALRAAGIHASNHYFPLHLLFGVDQCPIAEDIARRIINLWVDESITDECISQTANIINQT